MSGKDTPVSTAVAKRSQKKPLVNVEEVEAEMAFLVPDWMKPPLEVRGFHLKPYGPKPGFFTFEMECKMSRDQLQGLISLDSAAPLDGEEEPESKKRKFGEILPAGPAEEEEPMDLDSDDEEAIRELGEFPNPKAN